MRLQADQFWVQAFWSNFSGCDKRTCLQPTVKVVFAKRKLCSNHVKAVRQYTSCSSRVHGIKFLYCARAWECLQSMLTLWKLFSTTVLASDSAHSSQSSIHTANAFTNAICNWAAFTPLVISNRRCVSGVTKIKVIIEVAGLTVAPQLECVMDQNFTHRTAHKNFD